MTDGRSGDAKLAAKAAKQDGVFSRKQALAAGLTDDKIKHRLGSGMWLPVYPRIYRFTATPPTLALERRGALMWAGDRAVLSHRSAAEFWQLDGVEASKPELTIVGTRFPKSDEVIVHRTITMHPHDRRQRDGLAITSPARTVVDLASVLAPESLECALESARRMRLTSDADLARCLARIGGRGRLGARKLDDILDEVRGQRPCESTLEVRVANLLRATELPPPVRQHWIRVFGVRYRVDFAWPDIKIALECDSRRWHEFQKDRTRWRRLCSSGWRILPVTKRDVTRDWPGVLHEIESAFSTIGRFRV